MTEGPWYNKAIKQKGIGKPMPGKYPRMGNGQSRDKFPHPPYLI